MNRFLRWSLPVCMAVVAMAFGWWWRQAGTSFVPQPFWQGPVDGVLAIHLQGGEVDLTYEWKGDLWKQTKPFEQPADPTAIRDLLAAIADAAPVYRMPIDRAPKESRLALPDVTLTVTGPQQVEQTLLIGADHPAGMAWVGQAKAGEAGPCVADVRRLALAALGGALRDDHLFELAGADSQRILMRTTGESGESQLEMERTPTGWHMKAPFESRTEAAAVTEFLQAISRLRSQGVVQESVGDAAIFGLSPPRADVSICTLDVTTGKPRTETVSLGSQSPSGGWFARVGDRPPVVLIDDRTIRSLLPDATSFIDLRGCAMLPNEVSQLRVLDSQGQTRLHLQRDRWEWMRNGADGTKQPIEPRSVKELVHSLCEARATALRAEVPQPEWLIAVVEVVPLGGNSRRVHVWRLPDGQWAMHDGDGPTRLFPASLSMPLQPSDHPPKR